MINNFLTVRENCFYCTFLENSFPLYNLRILCLKLLNYSRWKSMLACKAIYVGGSGSGSNLIVHICLCTSKLSMYVYGQNMLLDLRKPKSYDFQHFKLMVNLHLHYYLHFWFLLFHSLTWLLSLPSPWMGMSSI